MIFDCLTLPPPPEDSGFRRRDPAPSNVPTQERTGVVQIFNGDTSLGYLSATTQQGAIYKIDSALVNAAMITVVSPTGQTSGSGLRVTVSVRLLFFSRSNCFDIHILHLRREVTSVLITLFLDSYKDETTSMPISELGPISTPTSLQLGLTGLTVYLL